tara:strand:+ start:2420 stop:3544 length:1125 start_codon:yes stop_codon:yes gene_type:complete
VLKPKDLFDGLKDINIDFYAGVPDSLLKNFCNYVDDNSDSHKHLIAANEGNAISIAAGYHLTSGKVGAVYLQNSGLGNCVNPLLSLTHEEVYSIPIFMIIGWRGEPGVKDEPQHIKQGQATIKQLEMMDVDYLILDKDSNLSDVLKEAMKSLKFKRPFALLVKRDTFLPYEKTKNKVLASRLSRERAIREIIRLSSKKDLVFCTTGKASRELYEIRVSLGGNMRDFLTVGSMGHTSSIALGAALGRKDLRVVCIDGDGAMLMHMGGIAIIGDHAPNKYIHVVLNNSAHESVGGQETVAGNMDLKKLSESCQYSYYGRADDIDSLKSEWKKLEKYKGPVMLEILISTEVRNNLGRPKSSAKSNKEAFMNFVKGID